MSDLIGILATMILLIVSFICSVCFVRCIDIIIFKFRMLKRHIEKWNYWRKHNTNSKLYKVLVLLKLKYSPTFALTVHPKDIQRATDRMQKGLKNMSGAFEQMAKSVGDVTNSLTELFNKELGDDSNEQE